MATKTAGLIAAFLGSLGGYSVRGARPLATVLCVVMLSACAGTPGENVVAGPDTPSQTAPRTYAEAVDARVANVGDQDRDVASEARHSHRHRYHDDPHLYSEPSPEAQHAAEVALLLTGSAFLCTFVVVVLDGACNFGASFGYHYY